MISRTVAPSPVSLCIRLSHILDEQFFVRKCADVLISHRVGKPITSPERVFYPITARKLATALAVLRSEAYQIVNLRQPLRLPECESSRLIDNLTTFVIRGWHFRLARRVSAKKVRCEYYSKG